MNIKKIITAPMAALVVLLACGCSKTPTTTATTENVATTTKKPLVTATTTEAPTTWILPDMTGYSTEQVIKTLEESPLENYAVNVKGDILYGDGEGEYQYETFYGYAGKTNVIGAEVSVSKKLNVYVTAYNIYDSMNDFLEANPEVKEDYAKVTLAGKSYEGKSFIETGCGEVSVVSYVDGDTTRFKDQNGTTISLRYLGIDTPESTASFEAWGKAASNYTKTCLSNAKKVVLEADEPGQMDGNERYLGWVWYQDMDDVWHMLNLELVLFCYTKDKSDSDTVYGKVIAEVGTIMMSTKRRVWGETDPDFDYSDGAEVSLQELRTNFGKYYAKNVTVTGVVAMVDGASAVIVDPDTGYGIYFYIPDWKSNDAYDIVVGNKITITGVATYYGSDSEDFDVSEMDEDLGQGSPQMTDFKASNVTVLATGITVEPQVLTISGLDATKIGMYCTFKDLTITRVYEASTKSGFTVTCKDSSGNTISIRVDDSHYYIAGSQEDGVSMDSFKVGGKIASVTGYLSYYYGYQVGLVSKTMVEIDE